MGAAQDQDVDPRALEGRQIMPRDLRRDRVPPPSLLDERDEKRAGGAEDPEARPAFLQCLGVGAGGDGRLGADDAHAPVAARLRRRLRAGLDHAEDGNPKRGLDFGQGKRRRGVAGHNQGLDVARGQESRHLKRIASDGLPRFRPVWDMGGIPEIHEALLGHAAAQGLEHRQAPDPGIKDSDGAILVGFSHVNQRRPSSSPRAWRNPAPRRKCRR